VWPKVGYLGNWGFPLHSRRINELQADSLRQSGRKQLNRLLSDNAFGNARRDVARVFQFAELWNAAQRITSNIMSVNEPSTTAKSRWLDFMGLILVQNGRSEVTADVRHDLFR
jgi:hypothetical protein